MEQYYKAITAFVATTAGALLTVITGDMTFADLTTAQWLAVSVLVFGTTGAVYAIPNNPEPEPTSFPGDPINPHDDEGFVPDENQF